MYAPFSYGVFDVSTSEALGLFQKNFGLSITGEVSHDTVLAMEAYRCGVPDIDRGIPELGKFTLSGCSYSNRVNMTYRFDTITRDLPTDSVREAVRNAFSTWSRVVPITFREVATDQAADFRIGWFTGNHGDGSPFDGAGDATGNVLAHAFYPPNCGGANAGLMHFDDFETWAVAASGTAMDLETVALHEIGHLLGLAHSDVNGSVMFPSIAIGRTNRILTADDIAGIQRLYGTRAFNAETYSTDQSGRIFRLQAHDWRRSWDLIVPGNFGGTGFTDLLFYDRRAGHGEFYLSDGQGGISLQNATHGWRKSWDLIVPGNFGGTGFTGLLFYDRKAGHGEFYLSDGQGGISLQNATHGWRKSWHLIVPGDFDSNINSGLVFYER